MWNQKVPQDINHDIVIIPQYDNDDSVFSDHGNNGNDLQQDDLNSNNSSHENDDPDIFASEGLNYNQQVDSNLEESSFSIIILSDSEKDESMNQDANCSEDPQTNSFDDTIIGAWSQLSLNDAFIIPNRHLEPCRPVNLNETIVDIEEYEKEETPISHNNFKPLMRKISCESIYYEDIGMSNYIYDSE